jgi:pimeloyl-ACP methyl ester carboxylesterase
LVITHGFSTRWQGHLAYIEKLSGYHIYPIDHAGHGLSGDRRGTNRLLDFVDDMAEFIECVPGAEVDYFGASLGALVGLNVAGIRPELINFLVLGDAPIAILTENYMVRGCRKPETKRRKNLRPEFQLKRR